MVALRKFNVVLISTYDLGRQPFGLASPAAWLREVGASVSVVDLSVSDLDDDAIREAQLIACYVPMHTATRLAVALLDRLRHLNGHAHVCFYGLYAPMNGEYLRGLGVDTILGGEFEQGLTSLYQRLASEQSQGKHADGTDAAPAQRVSVRTQPEPEISVARQRFRVPDRVDLSDLSAYAKLVMPSGETRVVGYVEASRGCKHLCRHCPIVPVYEGRFTVVQPDIVLADIEQQVAGGARHVTFGDPDFFNGPTHALRIVRALHDAHPEVSYDVTIKVEHLVKHSAALEVLRDTGCAFVTSAVESVDDHVLERLDKRHTAEELAFVVERFRELDMHLSPTFVAFTPWTTLAGYAQMLTTIAELGLVDNVAPIQYAIRLLIPAGSKLLELDEVTAVCRPFEPHTLSYPWIHPDPRVDELQRQVLAIVADIESGTSRWATFANVLQATWAALDEPHRPIETPPGSRDPVTIPYMTEPWYC